MLLADLTSTIDHAAQQNDRWMFIGTLVILGLVAWMVARYFVRQHEGLISDHKEARLAYQQTLQKIIDQQNTLTKEVAAVLALNNKIIEQNSEWLQDTGEALRAVRPQRGSP